MAQQSNSPKLTFRQREVLNYMRSNGGVLTRKAYMLRWRAQS